MLKHVLVPLDGSKFAEQALVYAERLIDGDGQLTLLSVVEDVPIYPLVSPSPPLLAQEIQNYRTFSKNAAVKANQYLHEVSEKISVQPITLKVIVSDNVAAAIIEEAQESAVDVIVMSTHGYSGINRWLLGSVTQKVLQASPCPILVIPNKQIKVT